MTLKKIKSNKTLTRMQEIKEAIRAHNDNLERLDHYAKGLKIHVGTKFKKGSFNYQRTKEDGARYLFTVNNLKQQIAFLTYELKGKRSISYFLSPLN